MQAEGPFFETFRDKIEAILQLIVVSGRPEGQPNRIRHGAAVDSKLLSRHRQDPMVLQLGDELSWSPRLGQGNPKMVAGCCALRVELESLAGQSIALERSAPVPGDDLVRMPTLDQ